MHSKDVKFCFVDGLLGKVLTPGRRIKRNPLGVYWFRNRLRFYHNVVCNPSVQLGPVETMSRNGFNLES